MDKIDPGSIVSMVPHHLVNVLFMIKTIIFNRFCMSQCSDTYEPICSFKTGHTYLNKCFYECFHNESEFEMEYMFGRNCRRIGDDFKKICLKNKNKERFVINV